MKSADARMDLSKRERPKPTLLRWHRNYASRCQRSDSNESNGQSNRETPPGDTEGTQITSKGFEEVISEEPGVLESIRLQVNPCHTCIEDARESRFERSPRV